MDGTWGKRQALPNLEPHRLLGRLGDASDARAVIQHQMQQPDSLKEVVIERTFEELFLERQRGIAHKVFWAPTRGGQRFIMPLRCRVRAVRRLYEFTEL